MTVSAPTNTRFQDNAGPTDTLVTPARIPKTSGSVTLTAGIPHLVVVVAREASATADLPTITSTDDVGGATGDVFNTLPGFASGLLFNTNIHRIMAWWVTPASTGPRVLLPVWAGSQTYWCGGVARLNDASPTAPIAQNVATGTGTSTAPLATHAAMAATSATLYILGVATSTPTVTEGSGFTYLGGTSNANIRGRIAYQLAPDTSIDATLSVSNAWGMVGMELQSSGGGNVVVPVVLSFTIDPADIPAPELPPVEPPPVDETGGGEAGGVPSDVQSPFARPRVERSTDPALIIARLEDDVRALRGEINSRHGSLPVYAGADPTDPPDGYVWLRSDTRERCSQIEGVTVREPL